MSTTQSTQTFKTSWIRRLAAGAALAAVPAIIALGATTTAHADSTVNNPGPGMSVPAHHPAFPHQANVPRPGTNTHHHHQRNRR